MCQAVSGPSFQCPQEYLGFFRQKKKLLFVLVLATVPGYKPGQKQGKEVTHVPKWELGSVVSFLFGQEGSRAQAGSSDTLWCL